MFDIDEQYMLRAFDVAADGLGKTHPNPSVGCVIVSPDKKVILGEGRTSDGGRPPHAEVRVLEMIGDKARGAIVYTTLEPCIHDTLIRPVSCAQALIDAGVKEVFYAAIDHNPRMNGKGIAMLKDAGIQMGFILLPEKTYEFFGEFFSRFDACCSQTRSAKGFECSPVS